MARACDDGIEHLEWFIAIQLSAGFGGGMNNVRETAARKCEVSYVAWEEMNGGMPRQVRNLTGECFRCAGQNRDLGIQLQTVVRPSETLEQPASEKTGPAGSEDARVSQF